MKITLIEMNHKHKTKMEFMNKQIWTSIMEIVLIRFSLNLKIICLI